MGNAIKNYEKKRRKERREAYREIQQIVHNTTTGRLPLPTELKEHMNAVSGIMFK